METEDWTATGPLNECYRQVRALGLEPNVAELEAFGFTVIEPGRAAPVSFVERLRDRLLETATEVTGVPHALDRPGDRGRYEGQPHFRGQYVLHFLALEDEVYTEALLNPVAVSLAAYLLGDDYRLSSLTGFVKWGESYGEGLGLHTDSPAGRHGELPPTDGFVANVTWVLTDYTEENGALAIVPGSHRLARRPAPGEGVDDAVPVEAPAGSLIVWHGNTWHGAFPKTTPGLRLTLVSYLCRPYIRTQEDYRGSFTPEVRARLPRRMVEMLGGFDPYGWTKEGPQFATYKAMAAGAAPAENGSARIPATVGGPAAEGAVA